MKKICLAVMYGSRSSEHEVSIISAVQLMQHVNREKYDLVPIYISQKGVWYTGDALLDMRTYTPFDPWNKKIKKVQLDLTAGSGALVHYRRDDNVTGHIREEIVARINCVIPVFHGLHGEDGSVQGILEIANLPYASTGICGSAIGMDKIAMKAFFLGCGFPVLPGFGVTRSQWEKDRGSILAETEKIGWPVFVKPACLGSSIGVSRADNAEELIEAMELALSYDRRVLIEKGLDKPAEVNCSVLGYDDQIRASVLEMPNAGGESFLGFKEKYLQQGASKGMASLKRIIPAPIGDELTSQLQELSMQIFKAMDCKGVVRIDYMLDRISGRHYITEINTIPGSLSFYLWKETDLDYTNLIDCMVDAAMRAKADKDRSSYAYSSDILKGVTLGPKAGGKLGGVKR
ncbi:MAG: D-alanine--D-alanine ligase [Clostridia bacterium]|nr:D-alanine--D-alanine ligase [Clostridia bacterium]